MNLSAIWLAAGLSLIPPIAQASENVDAIARHYAALAAAVETLASPGVEPRESYSAFRIEEELSYPSLMWAEVNRGANVLHFQLYNGSRAKAFDNVSARLFVSDGNAARDIISMTGESISFGADVIVQASFDPEPYAQAVACVESQRNDGVHVSQLHLLTLNKAHPDRVFFTPERTLIRFHDGKSESLCSSDAAAYAASGTLTQILAARMGDTSVAIEVGSDSTPLNTSASVDEEEFFLTQKVEALHVGIQQGFYTLDLVNLSPAFAKEIVSAHIYLPDGSGALAVIENLPLPASTHGFVVADISESAPLVVACIEWRFAGSNEPRFMQRIDHAEGEYVSRNEYIEGPCAP